MSAIIRVIPNEDFPVLQKYLTDPGVVLVRQDIAEQITQGNPEQINEISLDQYNFGGEPDIWMDFVHDTRHFAVSAIQREAAIAAYPADAITA
ncbi:MAG: hypothetical protein IJP78_06195 [Clostridia bacterium]|nr:hypothetical protein [Clostridia bacterium]